MSFLFLLFFIESVFSQARVDGLVAIVGGNIVLHSDVLQQAQIAASSSGIDPRKSPYLFEKLYVGALENMVNQYAVLDIAKRDTNLI